MSVMSPVVLVSLPNANFLLGTFDTANFKRWWRSRPFPDDLENIKKGFHIYGRTHLALAQRTDGRWAVYRSKNYGIDWARAWLAAEGEVIYDIVLITYGWAILNTSLGFYETVDSGVTWTLVLGLPSAPNAPAFYNIGGGDVLVCTDGRYIWRSTDISRSWVLVCDMDSIEFSGEGYHNGTVHYTGPSKACIAGASGKVFAAHGPFLAISTNAGLTWSDLVRWAIYNASYSSYYPPRSIIYDRIWGQSNLNSPAFLISQILITSVDGPTGDDVCFAVRTDDLLPVSGETSLYSRVFVTFSAYYANYGYQKNWFFKLKYQQYRSPTDGLQLSSYDVAVLGADYNDKLVFSAQTVTDSSGNTVPSLKYSIDSGATWVDIDLSKVEVGDPNDGGSCAISMMDDNFAELTWVAPACNNAGHYSYTELSRRQCQSYEFDVVAEGHRTKNYDLASNLSKDHTKSYQQDALAEARISKPYQLASNNEGQRSKAYRMDRTLEGESEKTDALDAIVSQDNPIADEIDAVISGRPKRYYRLAVYMQDRPPKSYSMDCILERYQLNKRLAKIGEAFPQVFDLDLPRDSGGDDA